MKNDVEPNPNRVTELRNALFVLLITLPLAVPLSAQSFKTLYRFTGKADGGFPTADLVLDGAGNLYGTTYEGGDLKCLYDQFGCGTVFQLSPSNREKALYRFTGGSDGSGTYAAVVRDGNGNLYGTAYQGGDYGCGISNGCGTVFQVNPAGNETTLYTFTGGADGAIPFAGLVRDSAGNLYGVTTYGGDNSGFYGHGVVFELDVNGNETVLHTFSNSPDGALPNGRLLFDNNGNLFGTTYLGGNVNSNCPYGCGTVFELSPNSNGTWTEIVRVRFSGTPDGSGPEAGLVQDVAGNLYGTTLTGGKNSPYCFGFGVGCGTVFKLSPSGKETVLHRFKSLRDGATPWAGLLLDPAKHVLYGTTRYGGMSKCGDQFGDGCGTVFSVNLTNGKETILHTFLGNDGAFPFAGLIRDKMGHLYGTTSQGSPDGTVFELLPK